MKKKANMHESIKAKQREISLPYSERKPSEVTNVYWIYAERRKGKYPLSTPKSGKWLIFVDIKDVDEVWAKIKKATEEGKLGGSAKVATAKPNPLATDPNKKVICVYTYDWTDEEDVSKVREELRKLGITNKIAYKADEDTLSGKYRITGHTRISKYYE
jgi:nitrogen regulatory protein PII